MAQRLVQREPAMPHVPHHALLRRIIRDAIQASIRSIGHANK